MSYLTYKKASPSEIIEIGDLVMIDIDSGYITRAYLEKPLEFMLNTNLVIGVCVDSNNTAKLQKVLDSSNAKTLSNKYIVNGGTANNVHTIVIYR